MSLANRASAARTITSVNSLATSAGLTVGACTDPLDNTTNNDELLTVAGEITVAAAGLSAGTIEIWAFDEIADGVYPNIFTVTYSGSAGGFTVRNRDILASGAKLVASIPTDTTASRPYPFARADLVARFGGFVRRTAFFVTHNTGAALASSGNAITTKTMYWA